jgi:poly(3-hydroxybutyrate) depolymerase
MDAAQYQSGFRKNQLSQAAAVLLLACAAALVSPPGVAQPRVHLETLGPGGQRYTLSVPDGYSPAQPAPLVVSLHFGGHVSPHYGRLLLESVVEPALRPLGALMVAPDCDAPAWAAPECDSFVLDLLDHVANEYAVDRRRVLLLGYSKGGTGTWELAARHPDRFTAAIVMAGRPRPEMSSVDWRVPLYVIHAREDEVLALGPTQEIVTALRDRGVPVELHILEGVTHYEMQHFVRALHRALPWLERTWGRP